MLASTLSYPVPPDGAVLALVDATVFGSAKNGMAITPHGLFWSNGGGWADTETKRNHVTWAELKAIKDNLVVSGKDLVFYPDSPFGMAGSSVEPKALIGLLKKCLKLMDAPK
jgi:sugar lactone lactonase YvrE